VRHQQPGPKLREPRAQNIPALDLLDESCNVCGWTGFPVEKGREPQRDHKRETAAWVLNLQNFKTKVQNTSKIPNFQNALKYQNTSKYIKTFHFFPIFLEFWCEGFLRFLGFSVVFY